MKKLSYIAFCVLLVCGCKPQLARDTPNPGEANVSVYLAVGNSLTAGYADNSLYRRGQQNSYPNILATQFKLVGGGEFKQPLLPGEYGFPDAKMVLAMRTNCAGVTALAPVDYTGWADTVNSSLNISSAGPFNNLGVPGIRAVDFLYPGYANIAYTLGEAPFAKRIFKDPSKRPLDELKYTMDNLHPTFFTLWLGSNDVLRYATEGGEGDAPGTPFNGLVWPEDISPTDLFQRNYDSVISVLVRDGAKGVVINIPDITAIPFFTTIPVRGLKLDETEVIPLTAIHSSAGLTFAAGENYYVIEDEAATGGKRLIKSNEYILLEKGVTDSMKCAGWGKTVAIPREYVLTEDEINNVRNATATFNQIILQAAQKYGLAHVDINSFLKTVVTGYKFNGVEYNTEYISGGAFSLDGVHLTPRGYALVANEVIKAINSTYKASIPVADVHSYNGLLFP